MNTQKHYVLAASLAAVLTSTGFSAVVPITTFGAPTPTPAVNAWYYVATPAAGATGTIEAVPTGVGFNFGGEAAVLRLPNDNAAKVEVGTFRDFGLASSVLTDIDLSYQFYKATTASSNPAAPALKLQIFASGGTGDNFGTLIYEPYFETLASPPTDQWITAAIDENTGAGPTGTGGWWWNGGFEQPSGGGGPPIRSLSEWASLFASSDPTDFANAHVVSLIVGEGTFNPDQIGYFDGVSIATGGGEATVYDFSVEPVPEPGTALFGAAMVGCTALIRRRKVTTAKA